MRLHITLGDELVAELDRRAGPRHRSAYVQAAIRQALDDERRWDALEGAVGALAKSHEWDDDPAQWVRAQRSDARRVG